MVTTSPTSPHGRSSSQRGQTIALVTVFMVCMLGFTGMVIDVGHAYLMKRRLQAAVDAAVLAGAQDLPNTATAQSSAASSILKNYNYPPDPTPVITTSSGCQVAGCTANDKFTVSAASSVNTWFLRLFGYNSFSVSAGASACGPCDSAPVKYDVMVILDRTGSMCTDANSNWNNCVDLDAARQGVLNMLSFFSNTDQIGLAAVSSGDNVAPFSHTGPPTSYTPYYTSSATPYPCDAADPGDHSVSGKGPYYRSAGDFMAGTPSSHDSWVLSPLSSAFKKADGSVNTSSPLVTTMNCLQPKYWTAIAPAIQAATNELLTNGQSGSRKVIIYLGDGGANSQPGVVDSNGDASLTQTWYTPTSGSNGRPCMDAINRAAAAKSSGIEFYSIGYDLNSGYSGSGVCLKAPNLSTESAPYTAPYTLGQMATDSNHFFQPTDPNALLNVFTKIGHSITGGGTRLVQ